MDKPVGRPPSLASSVIELGKWRRHIEKQLQEIVASVREDDEGVAICVDPDLLPFLRLSLTEKRDAAASLEPFGMAHGRFSILGSGQSIGEETSCVLFLMRPSLEAAHWVSDMIKVAGTDGWVPSVCFFPRRSTECEAVWEASGVGRRFRVITEIGTGLVPWDDDVLTMEWPGLWAAAKTRSSPHAAEQVAESLLDLQTAFGPIPDLKAKGAVALRAVHLMLKKREQQLLETSDEKEAMAIAAGGSFAAPPPPADSLVARAMKAYSRVGRGKHHHVTGTSSTLAAHAAAAGGGSTSGPSSAAPVATSVGSSTGSASGPGAGGEAARAPPVECGDIAMCIVLDRDVDPVTPLLHSLTLEALLDDMVGISAGVAELPAEIAHGKQPDPPGAGAASASASAGAGESASSSRLVDVFMNSDNAEWTSVRDAHVYAAGAVISSRLQELQDFKASAHSLREKDMAAMKEFVSSIKDFEKARDALPRVLRVTQLLKAEVERPAFGEEWDVMTAPFVGGDSRKTRTLAERLVGERASPHRALRLLCLLAAAEGGMRQREVDSWRRALTDSYGFAMAMTLDALEGLGLLRVNRAAGMFTSGGAPDWNWPTLVRALKLGDESGSEANPTDTSFVTSCLAPLSVRLVQAAIGLPIGSAALAAVSAQELTAAMFPPQGGWSFIEAALKACPGDVLECLQLQGPRRMARRVGISAPGGPAGAAAAAATMAGKVQPPGAGASTGAATSNGAGAAGGDELEAEEEDEPRKTVLVYFIGGVTFAEVAALRWLGEKLPFDFLIATTHITSGRKLMEQAIEEAAMGGVADLIPDAKDSAARS